jgi:protoheme IX farnesyltransferase
MKRKSPFAVFIGAVPGAIPPLLGWVAATNSFSMGGWLLFSIQFLWQFPHFWAIAWVLDEDYKKAGFKMLPTGERDKDSAFQALLYTFSLLAARIHALRIWHQRIHCSLHHHRSKSVFLLPRLPAVYPL